MLQGHEQRFATGETILHQGAQGDRLYIIKSGTVQICDHSPNLLEDTPIAELGPGQMFGEMYLLSQEHTRNASAVALTEVTAYVVFEDAVAHDFQQMSPFQKIMFREMGRRLNDMNACYLQLNACYLKRRASADLQNADENPASKDAPSIQWRDSAISTGG